VQQAHHSSCIFVVVSRGRILRLTSGPVKPKSGYWNADDGRQLEQMCSAPHRVAPV
jgi:hypothetical protein